MAAFQFRFMNLAVNVIDRRGPSNEMHCQLQLKKAKVRLHVLAIYIAAKTFYLPFITNKTEHFSFKSGCVVQVENGEMHCKL